MAIEFMAAPAQALTALQAGAARVAAAPSLQTTQPAVAAGAARLMARGLGGRPGPTLSMPVHFPKLEELAAGRLDPSAPVLAWRHLLPADDAGARTIADTLATGDTHRFAALAGGAFPAALADTVNSLRVDPALASRNLTAAGLQVNEIGLRAVWLQAKDAGDDVVVALAPAPTGIEPGRRYGKSEMAAKLQAAVHDRLAQAGPHVEF